MNDEQNSFLNNDQTQLNCLKRIFNSTKGLIELIKENVTDIVADDMAEDFDFSSFFKFEKKNRFHSWPVFLAGTLFGALSVFGSLKYTAIQADSDQKTQNLIEERLAEKQTLTPIAQINIPFISDIPSQETETVAQTTQSPKPDHIETFTMKPRQNLSVVLKNGGLTNREIYLVSEALSEVLNLKQIQAGNKIEIGKIDTETGEKALMSVTIEDRHGTRYIATKIQDELFNADLIEPEVDIKTEYAEGTIDGPFILNAQATGIPTNVIHQIIWSFDGPVDFSRDLRKGDTFTAVFQKEYNKEGRPTGNGVLLYADIKTRLKTHKRFLYKDINDQEDYYDETGKIARKLFTLHPLAKPRVTSKFGKRKHPVLGYTLTHWGVDYGAPTGTPIRAPGDGTIVQAQRKGSYGNYIQIKHNSEYSTAYGHMSRFHKSIRAGRKVKAGDIIGYVGSTGRSTGPHLHWELIKNGKKINPVTQRITAQRKLKGEELQRFYAERDRMYDSLTGNIAYARAEALPEDRKMAYQEPKPAKKVKSKRKKTQKTASRKTRSNKG